MAGRPKIFDPLEVLNKAKDVFWEKGYEATSTADLCDAMGIGKGSFYQEFGGGKREVFEKAIDLFSDGVGKVLETRLKESANPLEEIRNIFRKIALNPVEDHLRGCFVGNTLVEMTYVDQDLEDKAIDMLKRTEALFHTSLLRAQEMGQLDKTANPGILAKCLITLWNGINLTRRMYPDRQILGAIIEKQLEILN
jgi:TetR/AcrR family transcriptional repressor of nem operon